VLLWVVTENPKLELNKRDIRDTTKREAIFVMMMLLLLLLLLLLLFSVANGRCNFNSEM
jgi:uncharacterized integral membrane protein